MAVALTLLEDVRWRGAVVAGERPRALLAALAYGGGRPVRAERLIELVWGDEAPANAAKSLQVLVSRTRTACGPDAIVRDGVGYRLGVAPAEVDSVRLATLARDAVATLDDDAARAASLAREALALGGDVDPARAGGAPAGDGLSLAGTSLAARDTLRPARSGSSARDGNGGGFADADPLGAGPDRTDPLAAVRRAAAADVATARVILAQASSRTGAHADALPALEAAQADRPDDESLLADLLRSEAAVRGPGAALERYERHRRDLRDRLGASPGERLQRAHRDLLALDRPVRSGVRYDATALLGRDQDVERLRALMKSARVVSIVGAGGLGKTRLAHVLARDADQPVVHFVELAGVTTAADVVGELGSALGVRDSISGRRTLTPAQRADVRARVAQRLAQAPSLLVLDNCEHLVEAVAELVAFLVSTTADLRILTTSRAPLAIAAERVYQLGQLDTDDGAELFRQRATAARPEVQLPDDVVKRIAARLDGLPLALELAAAKVRAMSVEEIDRRLENRFALLRGGDRSAPDRHQTLLAVIDWSWNLLDEDERRALRRLALFNDGFTLDAADEVLGDGALDAVRGLVDQSLLSVRESPGGIRYRMLETVREFGAMQLIDAGEDGEARAARRTWATAYATRHGKRLATTEQIAGIDALDAEEVNLADELRDALADADRAAIVALVAALGTFWAIRGEHGRLIVLSEAVGAALRDWTPSLELEDATRLASAIVLTNAMIVSDERTEPVREVLRRLGPGTGGDPRMNGMIRVMLAYDPADARGFAERLETLAEDPDRWTALTANQWLSHARENAGDPRGAVTSAQRALALVSDEGGPWTEAIIRHMLASVLMHLGESGAAVAHARTALPVMQRLGARDDELQLHSVLVSAAIAEGRLDDAEAELELIDAIDDSQAFGGAAVRGIGRAELTLARGEHAAGLRAYREAAATMRTLEFPGIPRTDTEPWMLYGTAAALAAHAYHASGADEARGRELFATSRGDGLRMLDFGDPFLDYPVIGMVLFGLGAWALLRDAAPQDDALRLLLLADRFACTRSIATLSWERMAARADERAPGRLAELSAEYAERAPQELSEVARGCIEQLPA